MDYLPPAQLNVLQGFPVMWYDAYSCGCAGRYCIQQPPDIHAALSYNLALPESSAQLDILWHRCSGGACACTLNSCKSVNRKLAVPIAALHAGQSSAGSAVQHCTAKLLSFNGPALQCRLTAAALQYISPTRNASHLGVWTW